MAAKRMLGPDEDIGDYEVPERLMNGEDVKRISSILGIPAAALNNYEPLPEPAKAGAGRVNPFTSEKRAKFVEPEESHPEPSRINPPSQAEYVPTTTQGDKVPRLDYYNIIHNLFLSRYKFLPPFLDLYHLVGEQTRELAGPELFKFPGSESTQRAGTYFVRVYIEADNVKAAYGYVVPKEEVQEQAARAWYRTHLICQRAAEGLEARGPNQLALGLRSMGANSTTAWRQAVAQLKSKSSRAKAQALKLYPKLLQEENEASSQGPTWTAEDTQYYLEMADNHDRVERFEKADEYKGRAMEFICEALSVYLEWKQENPAKATKYAAAPIGSSLLKSPYFGGAGGLAKIWSEAAKWSFDPEIIPFYSQRFRWWWLRAAMARGHAEWLTMELNTGNPSYPERTMNDLKLLSPAPIGCYVNHCVIMVTLGIIHPQEKWPFYEDDQWQTNYLCCQMDTREWEWSNFGERNYNFAPGAPDFVFFEKAKTGWANGLLGMFPSDTNILAIQTGYFNRYYRHGLAHCIPKSASAYERALAVCADDVVMEFEQNRYIDILTLPDSLGSNILADMETEIFSLANARRYLTEAEADRYDFEERINRRLQHHLSRVDQLFKHRDIIDLEDSAKLIFLARIQKTIGRMLGPWYKFVVWNSLSVDEGPWHLLSAAEYPDQILMTEGQLPKVLRSTLPEQMIKYWMLRRIFASVENCRKCLVGGRALNEEEWHFITPFRAYLETGSDEDLPLVTSGLEMKPEMTVFEWRRTRIYRCDGDCGCAFDKAEAAALATAKERAAGRGQAGSERDRIKQAFSARDAATRSRSTAPASAEAGQVRDNLLLQMLASAREDIDLRLLEEVLSESAEGRRVISARQRQREPVRQGHPRVFEIPDLPEPQPERDTRVRNPRVSEIPDSPKPQPERERRNHRVSEIPNLPDPHSQRDTRARNPRVSEIPDSPETHPERETRVRRPAMAATSPAQVPTKKKRRGLFSLVFRRKH